MTANFPSPRFVALMVVVALLLAAGARAVAQVDLTPRTSERELEGRTLKMTRFADGGRTMLVDFGDGFELLPRGRSRLVLVPRSVPGAEIVIDVSESGFPRTSSGLAAFALGTLADEAEVVSPPAAEPEEWMSFNRADTWYLDLEFRLAGESYARRIVFWTFEGRQFRFIITARPDALERVFKRLKAPLLSWQWDDGSHLRPVAITIDKPAEAD